MRKINLFAASGLFLIASAFIFQSCSQEENEISADDIAFAQDEAFADALFQETDNMVSAELVTLDGSGYIPFKDGACYTVTVDHPDSTTFPKVVTINFGDGCTTVFNGDTIVRSGKIIVTNTGRWFVPGSQHIVTFDEYYFNGVKVEGTRTVENEGINQEGHIETSITLDAGKLTFEDETWITRDASHLREWARYPDPLQDTVWVTGSASGTNRAGEEYSRDIIEPLVMVRCSEYNHRWIAAGGKIEVTNSVRGTIVIDYTGSDCTGAVKIRKDGNEYTYHFRFRDKVRNR